MTAAASPLLVPTSVLEATRARMEGSGVVGVEATGLVVAGPDRVARHVVFPDQRAGRSPCCWVQVTEHGKTELALALGPQDRYVARIHSHPGCAFHSATDDRNPALRYEGALSIVVPYFGLGLRAGLQACGVFVRRRRRWVELAPGPCRDEVIRAGYDGTDHGTGHGNRGDGDDRQRRGERGTGSCGG